MNFLLHLYLNFRVIYICCIVIQNFSVFLVNSSLPQCESPPNIMFDQDLNSHYMVDLWRLLKWNHASHYFMLWCSSFLHWLWAKPGTVLMSKIKQKRCNATFRTSPWIGLAAASSVLLECSLFEPSCHAIRQPKQPHGDL